MIKAFARLGDTGKLGFQGDHILTMSIRVPRPEPEQITSFYQQALSQVQGLPGVQQAATVSSLPFTGDSATGVFIVEGRPLPRSAEMPRAAIGTASPDYFRTMRIPLLTGRLFAAHDDASEPPVAILSQSAAHAFWPSQNPIGTRIHVGPVGGKSPWRTIVGTVGDVKQFWLDTAPQPTIYIPFAQSPNATTDMVVHTAGEPTRIAFSVRREILAIDPTASIYNVKSMSQVIDEMMAGIRVATGLMAVFGAIAMILAAAGVYGMIAYTVTLRWREIGIRIALGVRPRVVIWLFVRRAVKLAGIGIAVALPAAFVLTRIMSHALFGIVTLEATIFLAFVLILVTVATMAAYLPARRATRVDPVIALRYE